MDKILVVDDVKDYVRSFCRILSDEYEIISAYSLKEAKKKMDHSIKLALVDIRLSEEDMSNRDGIIFLGWLRQNFPKVPGIMMSAYRDFDSAVDSLNLGAIKFLKKPIILSELKYLIRSTLKS